MARRRHWRWPVLWSDPPFFARQPGRRRQRERLPGLGVGGPLQWAARTGAARQSSASRPAAAASSMTRAANQSPGLSGLLL